MCIAFESPEAEAAWFAKRRREDHNMKIGLTVAGILCVSLAVLSGVSAIMKIRQAMGG